MKKKISLLICMLVAVLSFTGCSSTKTEVEYDEAEVEQVTEFLIGYCVEMDDATLEQWQNMTDFALEQQLTNAGLPFTPESFLGALESWEAGVDECGEYIEHGDYTYEASSDELKVTTDAKYADRDASIEFVFDENLYLDSMTVNAKFTMGEILKKAGLNTLLGMGTVFVVLIFISILISLFKYIPAIQAAFAKKPKKAEADVEEAAPVPAAPKAAPAPAATDDAELVAVISAAIAASEGTTTDGFVVRSIKRRRSNKWN